MIPSCLTLFAGGGGADIGLQRAGFRHLACVEADDHACATLRAAGFPAVQAWIGDGQPERRARGKVLPPLPVWRHDGEKVHLLWASPPCQPFSRSGKRLGDADARNGWPAALEAIRAVRPRWAVVENVVGSPAEAWADELRALYPEVQVWRADAVDWGLPSHRDRVYVVAGPSRWTAPTPTHYGPGVPWLVRGVRQPWIGFGEALGLAEGEVGAVHASRASECHKPVTDRELQTINGPSQCISAMYDGRLAGHPFIVTMESRRGREGGSRWEATSVDSPATCIRTASGGSSLSRLSASVRHYLSQPGPAVIACEHKGHTNPHLDRGRGTACSRASDANYLLTGRRAVTVAEAALLVGFPPGYPLQGSKEAQYRQIGNAVAPVMAEMIGRAILAAS